MKFKLTNESKTYNSKTLHRIECVEPFAKVKTGDKGGWIESEKNLSQDGNAWVWGNAEVCGNARVYGNADYIVFKNNWSSGRYFTWTKSNNMWKVGCFHGTGEELIAKAYRDSDDRGKHYEAYVKLVETLQNL